MSSPARPQDENHRLLGHELDGPILAGDAVNHLRCGLREAAPGMQSNVTDGVQDLVHHYGNAAPLGRPVAPGSSAQNLCSQGWGGLALVVQHECTGTRKPDPSRRRLTRLCSTAVWHTGLFRRRHHADGLHSQPAACRDAATLIMHACAGCAASAQRPPAWPPRPVALPLPLQRPAFIARMPLRTPLGVPGCAQISRGCADACLRCCTRFWWERAACCVPSDAVAHRLRFASAAVLKSTCLGVPWVCLFV
jgi:hypothetical protein